MKSFISSGRFIIITIAGGFLVSCDEITGDSDVDICPNGGFCCRLRPSTGGTGTSFCVDSCSECAATAGTEAICPEDAVNVSLGCQGDQAYLDLFERLRRHTQSYVTEPYNFLASMPPQLNPARNFWNDVPPAPILVQQVIITSNPLDCQKECSEGSPNCELATLEGSDAGAIATLFGRVAGIDAGILSRQELLAMFDLPTNSDPCVRGDTKFSGGMIVNQSENECRVETEFVIPGEQAIKIGLIIPSTLQGTWTASTDSVAVGFNNVPETSVPLLFSSHTELDENFGGQLVELVADREWIRAQTDSGCIAVKYQ